MALTDIEHATHSNPLDVVERIASVNDWTFERAGEDEINILIKGGWGSIEKLANAKPDDLTGLRSVGDKTAVKIVEAAKAVLAQAQAEKPAAEEQAAEAPAEAESAPAEQESSDGKPAE